MGQHTWFWKNKEKYKEYTELCETLYEHEIGNIWLDDYYQIECAADEINEEYSCDDFHNCFRTNKRGPDGYIDDVIESKEECDKWLEDNKQFVQELDMEYLNKFWETYPNGSIHFG